MTILRATDRLIDRRPLCTPAFDSTDMSGVFFFFVVDERDERKTTSGGLSGAIDLCDFSPFIRTECNVYCRRTMPWTYLAVGLQVIFNTIFIAMIF